MAESALRELALMSDGGADARGLSEPEKALEKSMTSAVNTHEKNYARVMAMLHRELSFRGTPKSNRA